MKTILIHASWSSGSSALTGYIHHCGFHACPPFFQPRDPRTPIAFENIHYRNALHAYINIEKLAFSCNSDSEQFENFFKSWYRQQIEIADNLNKEGLVIKHPLQIFALPIIEKFCSPLHIVLTRQEEKIEATRIRRKWPDVFGIKGAKIIYQKIHNRFDDSNDEPFQLSYDEFLSNKRVREKLLQFCDLKADQNKLLEAEKFIRA